MIHKAGLAATLLLPLAACVGSSGAPKGPAQAEAAQADERLLWTFDAGG